MCSFTTRGCTAPTGPPGQLDVNLDPAGGVGLMRYILYAPDWTVLVDTSFGSDTPATEGSLDLLYTDRRAPPGLYVLDCIYQDEAGLEQDISVFGLSVPSRNVYTLNLTTGHANLGGATIAEPVSAYPYLVTPSAGSDALGPVCGVSFHSYDLNAALNGEEPPDTFVTSQQLYTFPAGAFPPSADAHFWKTDMGGIPAGLLDSDDHGIYQWEFEVIEQRRGDARRQRRPDRRQRVQHPGARLRRGGPGLLQLAGPATGARRQPQASVLAE